MRCLLLIVMAVLLSACNNQNPATPTFAITIVTIDPSLIPTRRPTSTATLRPTARPTRTPAPTRTPRPTLTIEETCKGFRLVFPIPEVLPFTGTATFYWQGVPRGAGIRLMVLQDLAENAKGLDLQFPGVGDGVFPVPLRLLPTDGQYRWRLVILHPTLGELCPLEGRFLRQPAPTPTPVIF
jgi:hypothetical protein